MVQQEQIIADTSYSTPPGGDELTVVVQAASLLPNTLSGNWNIAPKPYFQNNVEVNPAELVMVIKNNLKAMSWEIDQDGNLIINALDANNYSINNEGFLIYTYR